MAAKGVKIPVDLEINLTEIRKQGQAVGNILQRALNKNTRTKALDSLEKQILRARSKLQKLETSVTDALTNPTNHLDWMPEEFQKAYKEAKALEGEVKKIVTEARKIKPDASISEVRQSLEASTRTIGARRLGGKTSVTGVSFDTKRQIETLRNYEKLTGLMEKLSQEYQNNGGKGSKFLDQMKKEAESLREQISYLVEDCRELSYQSGNSIQNALQPMVNFNQEISGTINTISQAFGPYVQIAQTTMSALVEVTTAEIKALKTLGSVAISAFKPLVSLAEAAGSAIKGIFSTIKKHNETTMKNLWRNILKYGIGVRSFYFLVRKIRNVIGDVVQELAKQIPEVNAQMSAFKTAVNGLKGALATAFQPILTAVLPALTALINAVSRAIAVVGKFIALLTGQNFVYAATATQVDYAASLDKTGKSAKKAKKELEGYLSPIDEINKYQTKDNDDNSGGGGGADSPYSLTKMPIEDWIKDLWDRIRKAWQNANFYELGKMLGDKLAEMLAKIPWDKIKNEARRLGKSLATLLNGIMDGEFDGKTLATYIGETIAQAINTAFEFVNQFVKNFNWKRLGEFIVEMLQGVFDTLDWNVITETFGELGLGLGETIAKIFEDPSTFAKAGDALGKLVNALVDMIYNFFNQQSGEDIGNAIASFINSAIDEFNPNDFANMCNVIMATLLDSLVEAMARTKWDKIGEKLAKVINGIDFKTIFGKYKDLANNIIDGILTMLESFLDTLTPEKITEIGESIADFINGIDIQPKRFGTVANNLLNALLDMILETVSDIEWDKIGADIKAMLEEIDWIGLIGKSIIIKNQIETGLIELFVAAILGIRDSIIEKFKELGKNIVIGLLNGIREENPVVGVLKFFVSIVKAIKDFLGIHSPSTVFKEIGTDIWEGFIEGLKDIIDKAKEIWEKLKTGAEEKFEEIKEKVKEKTTALKDKVIEIYENIKEKVQEKITNLKEKVVEIYENIKEEVVKKVEALKENVVELYETIKTNIEEKVEVIKERVVELYEDIKEEVTEKVEELKEKVVDKYDEIKTEITDKVDSIKTTVEDTWTDMKESTIGIFEDMWTGIKKVINSILAGIEAFVNGIITGFNKAIEAINTLAFDIPDWVPEVGGNTIGFSIPTLHKVSIPRLAQGSVIPPNKEFMAVLGDQKSGTNIETPLATMVEAFNTALRQNGNGGIQTINFLLPDRRKLASYTIEGGRIIQTSTGRNPFELA